MKPKHMDEVSLGALFLMQAAKKTDKLFKVKPQSTKHTVRDSNKDVMKMVAYLSGEKVHVEKNERNSPPFTDPTETGWKKISTTSWLNDTLTRSLDIVESDVQIDEDLQMEELDINDYEFSDN